MQKLISDIENLKVEMYQSANQQGIWEQRVDR